MSRSRAADTRRIIKWFVPIALVVIAAWVACAFFAFNPERNDSLFFRSALVLVVLLTALSHFLYLTVVARHHHRELMVERKKFQRHLDAKFDLIQGRLTAIDPDAAFAQIVRNLRNAKDDD